MIRALALASFLALPSASALADGVPLDTLLQRHQACQADADCRSLGRGARACGGPARWSAYSAQALKPEQEAALRRQAKREAEQQRAQLSREGRVGICQVLPDPGAHCSAQKRCEAGKASQG